MSDGYRVDLAALRSSAHGVRSVLGALRLESSGPVGATTGHDRLGAALDSFSDRWSQGVHTLIDDASALADLLESDERAYRGAEAVGAHRFGPVLDGGGPDPAAG